MGEELKDAIIIQLLKNIDDLNDKLDKEKDLYKSREGNVNFEYSNLVIPEQEPRRSGRSTRLIDKYVQDLFDNKGDWIYISDHVDNRISHKSLLSKVVSRLKNEHAVEISIDITDIRLKIK